MRTLLAEIWDGQSDGASWCRPLSPAHVQRTIMLAVAHHPRTTLADLDGTSPSEVEPRQLAADRRALPGLDGHVPAVEAVRMHLNDAGWDVVVRLTGIAQELANATSAELPANQHRAIALWAGGVVGAWFREQCSLPPVEYLNGRRDEELARRVDLEKRYALRLGDAELDSTYRQLYDQQWNEHGAATERECSPVALGLGCCQRPPWRGGEESNWRIGTDRSVVARYGDYFAEKGWARDPDRTAAQEELHLDRHIRTRIRTMTPETIVQTEVRRACHPLGLRHPEHRMLIAAVARGLCEADLHTAYDRRVAHCGPRPPDHRPTLTRWRDAGAALPVAEDTDLADAVARYAEQWATNSGAAKQLVEGLAGNVVVDPAVREVAFRDRSARPEDTPGSAGGAAQLDWHIQVQLGPPRRLWGHAHGREVEWEVPFPRAEAVRLIWSVFQSSMLDLRARPLDDPRGEPPADADHLRRLEATLRRLETDPQASERFMTLLAPRNPAWVAAYLDILTGGVPFGPEHAREFLSPADLLAHFGFDDDPEVI